jgi:ectoine hydroxylase-related dioxygenase (phytanoyl-CoA dioxygenase family)
MDGSTASTTQESPDGAVPSAAQIQVWIDEMLHGKGYFILPQVFTPEEIAEARQIIMDDSNRAAPKVTHFQGQNQDKLHLQRRVWNLLNKGDIFVTMLKREPIVSIVKAFLGDEFILGSIAANRLLPGGPGQELHVDYPYWDIYKRSSFPTNINPSYPLNMQATILLDDFTEENGATAIVPHTQKLGRYPDEPAKLPPETERMVGKAGDVAVFYGLCWHCAMPNNSDKDRTGLLIEYLPKFVKPLEDQLSGVRKEVIDKGGDFVRQLVGLAYPYPQLLDKAEGGNQEGYYSQKS